MDRESSEVVLQAVNQYTLGAAIGFINDQLFDMLEVSPEQPVLLALKQLSQVALTGLFVRQGLAFIHGDPPPVGYRDLTGGYFFMLGLYDGQPKFRANSKLIINQLTGAWGESVDAMRNNWAMNPSDVSPKGPLIVGMDETESRNAPQ